MESSSAKVSHSKCWIFSRRNLISPSILCHWINPSLDRNWIIRAVLSNAWMNRYDKFCGNRFASQFTFDRKKNTCSKKNIESRFSGGFYTFAGPYTQSHHLFDYNIGWRRMDYDNEASTKFCWRFWADGTIHNIRVAFDFAFADDRRTDDLWFDCAAAQTDQRSIAANVPDVWMRMVRLRCIDEARQYTFTSRQLNAPHFRYVVDFYHDFDIFLYGQFDSVPDPVEIHVAN